MSANYRDLLKYAATGIASPSMTYYDKMRASTLMGAVQTLTGIPPLSFKADGTPLISWSMKGNGSQSGTPTPDNPVMPEFVGARTGNLAQSVEQGGITNVGEKTTTSIRIRVKADVFPNTTYTFASNKPISIISGFTGETLAHTIISPAGFPTQYTFTTGKDDTVVYVTLRNEDNTTIRPADLSGAMLNLGSTALSYEPYGWKIPFENHGENLNATIPVYLGEVPTVRRVRKLVLTGKEFWQKSSSYKGSFYVQLITDYLQLSYDAYCTHAVHVPTLSQYSKGKMVFNGGLIGNCNLWFEQFDENTTVADFKAYLASEYAAGHPVTVWYVLDTPTTGIVNEPLCKIGDYADELHSEDASVTIPTVEGSNTLTVDTPLQPSEMTIKYRE